MQNKDPDLQKSDWLSHVFVVNKVAMWPKCDVSTCCVCISELEVICLTLQFIQVS